MLLKRTEPPTLIATLSLSLSLSLSLYLSLSLSLSLALAPSYAPGPVINTIPRRCVPSSIGEQTTGLGFAANGACCAAANPFLSVVGGGLCKSGVCGKKDPAVDKWNTCQPAVNFLASTRKVMLACTDRLDFLHTHTTPGTSPRHNLCVGKCRACFALSIMFAHT